MSNPIWNVGLFTKISKEQAECKDCKKAGRTKYVFELAHASVKHASCSAHLLNLAVKGSFKDSGIMELMAHCKRILGHFKHSNKAAFELKLIQEIEELPEHAFINKFLNLLLVLIYLTKLLIDV
jgi:hypothetical protein